MPGHRPEKKGNFFISSKEDVQPKQQLPGNQRLRQGLCSCRTYNFILK